jgi:hypothetical protein
VEVASLTIHVDGLGYQPTAVQRAAAIERESIELAEPSREAMAETAGSDQAHLKTTAEGKTASRRRKSR